MNDATFRPAGIICETDRQDREWRDERLPDMLREIVRVAAAYAWARYRIVFRIVSIYRTPEENRRAGAKTDTHVLWNALDVGAAGWAPRTIEDVTRFAVDRYQYDPDRPDGPQVVYSAPHGTGPHLHFQVWRPGGIMKTASRRASSVTREGGHDG